MGIFDKLFGRRGEPRSSKIIVHPEVTQDTKELINEERFWEIMDAAKMSSDGNYEKLQSELANELNKLEAIDILKFDNRFRTFRGNAYKWELWAAAYIMNGGCSDDCFLDFRGWLIGQGREVFYNSMSNPESLVDLNHDMDNDSWEGLAYVATDCYKKKTGKQMPEGINENYEITGEEWDEQGDDLYVRFPKLCAKWAME